MSAGTSSAVGGGRGGDVPAVEDDVVLADGDGAHELALVLGAKRLTNVSAESATS
jgi:hypothetical protein